MIKAVIFDLDGTIGDTLPVCIRSFRQAVEPYTGRLLTDKEIVAQFGPSEEGTLRCLLPEQFRQATQDYLRYYRENHHACPAPFDGMTELLGELKSSGVRLALVTRKGAGSCEITLKVFGLENVFEEIKTGSPLGNRKAEGIRSVLEGLDVAAEEAVYVGDAPSDVTESRKAGVKVVGAAWAATADVKALSAVGPDGIFDDISAFRNFLLKEIAR